MCKEIVSVVYLIFKSVYYTIIKDLYLLIYCEFAVIDITIVVQKFQKELCFWNNAHDSHKSTSKLPQSTHNVLPIKFFLKILSKVQLHFVAVLTLNEPLLLFRKG